MLLASGVSTQRVAAVENAALRLALDSINADDTQRHVNALADDTFEGRESGSRGNRAAGIYLAKHLQKCNIQAGTSANSYYQKFDNFSNILGVLKGSDPQLAEQTIIVSAHYDHVGYGSYRNSFGPVGLIHNGADDNASGVAALMEVIEAFTFLERPPRRSILFAFWDGEEKGLLGSKHWLERPTVPLARVPLMINADMVGRLRNDRLEVYGTRTAAGLRRIVSRQNDDVGLLLDFTWEMKDNSDHYPFIGRRIPALMFHTGLHDDYHRPSDDAEKINEAGLSRVARLMFDVAYHLADAPSLPGFRPAGRNETVWKQKDLERPLPPLPVRLGVRVAAVSAPESGIVLSRVTPGTPASVAGLHEGDRVVHVAGRTIDNSDDFVLQVLAAESPLEMEIQSSADAAPRPVTVRLAGMPVRLGISWRVDDAEPGCIILTRVVPGSAASLAGLRANDRIYAVDGQEFSSDDEFRRLVAPQIDRLRLTVETAGREREAVLPLPSQGAAPEAEG